MMNGSLDSGGLFLSPDKDDRGRVSADASSKGMSVGGGATVGNGISVGRGTAVGSWTSVGEGADVGDGISAVVGMGVGAAVGGETIVAVGVREGAEPGWEVSVGIQIRRVGVREGVIVGDPDGVRVRVCGGVSDGIGEWVSVRINVVVGETRSWIGVAERKTVGLGVGDWVRERWESGVYEAVTVLNMPLLALISF